MGRAEVEALLSEGKVALCPNDADGSRRLLARARKHVATARLLVGSDTETAADALHAANRKACEAVLLIQGLESTKDGGHTASIRVVREQTRTGRRARPELAVYETVRQLRHSGDYGNLVDDIHPDDITGNIPGVEALIDMCERLLEVMPVFVKA